MDGDIFVAGVSRSGSTALAMLLGTDPRVVVIGESWQLPSVWQTGRPCSCGAPLADCPFWRPISTRIPFTEYHPDLNNRLRNTIRDIHGSSVIVDTSKKAPYLRQVIKPVDVLVHLIRDPRGHALSRYRGWSSKRAEGVPGVFDVARTSISWRRQNSAARRLTNDHGGITLRYEEFVHTARATAQRILAAAGLHEDRLGERTAIQHIAAGNPARMRSDGLFAIKADFEWQTRLPKRLQLVSYSTALPHSALYGYPPVSR